MNEKLLRVGTTYIPVENVARSTEWYEVKLGAVTNYIDQNKAIINLANQSFFLVKADKDQTANFLDADGQWRFSITFEVNGYEALENLHQEFIEQEVRVGDIEDRGHSGNNFVFYDLDGNKFDVWSELSPDFKEKYQIT